MRIIIVLFLLMLASKGLNRIVSYYDNNPAAALVNLFPDIGIDTSKFTRLNGTPSSIEKF